MGVARGPLRASLLRRIDSSVSAGMGVPWVGTAPAPAAARSHSSFAPAASMASTAALTTSGPMPSPGISVTGIDMLRLLTDPAGNREEDHLDEEQRVAEAVEHAEPRAGHLPGLAHGMDLRREVEHRG